MLNQYIKVIFQKENKMYTNKENNCRENFSENNYPSFEQLLLKVLLLLSHRHKEIQKYNHHQFQLNR